MSDERKPVLCPWCRSEMRLWEDGAMAWFECMDCGAQTPTVDSEADDTPTETLRKMAYAAATATPPNLPLTREQVEAIDDNAAVYCVHGTDLGFAYAIDCDSAKIAKSLIAHNPSYFIHKWLFFDAAKGLPTPADIEAARKEHQ